MSSRVVGTMKFDNIAIDVYQSLDNPLFKASDIAKVLGLSNRPKSTVLDLCEFDEIITFPSEAGDTHFVTEMGLYNILSQNKSLTARKWRKVVNQELIDMRKMRNLNILEQFEKWHDKLDDIFFDESTGIIMQITTVQGGDVDISPYSGEPFWEEES